MKSNRPAEQVNGELMASSLGGERARADSDVCCLVLEGPARER
jgi:hypothetical protein